MDNGVKGLLRAIMPRAIRPRRILGGPPRGCWLVTSWHDYPAGLSGRTGRALLDGCVERGRALNGMRDALMRWHLRIVLELHAGVSRERVLSLLESLGYSRDAVPVDPLPDEGRPRFADDRSYAFKRVT
jgi:hypothetical protein